jgi:DNA-binding NarL/FixJ family response regulator/anti-anti-sigma regulatory factor
MLEAIHVLQIEDSPLVVELTRSMLAESTGVSFALESVGSLAQGIQRLARDGVDVVLLDLTLPDSQGLDTFHSLHAVDAKIPIVIYTNFDDEALSLLALQHGAADYLVKSEVNAKWLARALALAPNRSRTAATEDKAAKPDGAKAGRTIEIEKSTSSPGSFRVKVNDKRMVSVVTMEAIKIRLLQTVQRSDCDEVRIDFSKVEYVANAAISMLLIVNKQAKAANKELVFSNVLPQVYEQFTSRRFDKVFRIERANAES